MAIRVYRCAALAVILACPAALARDPDPAFRRLGVEDGLSQGTITAILQDRKGFMWIGTQDGLNRFDGLGFTVFRHNPMDTTSLAGSWITALYEDGGGTLWVGTREGLHRFDRGRGSFARIRGEGDRTGISSSWMRAIGELGTEARRRVWVANPNLHFVDSTDVFRIGPAGAAAVLGARTFLSDNRGLLWIVGRESVLVLDASAERVLRMYDAGRGADIVTAAWEGGTRGGIWLGGGGGLRHLDTAGGSVTVVRPEKIGRLLVDGTGFVWAGLMDGGLLRFDASDTDHSVRVFHHDPGVTTSISHNGVTTLFRDADDGIWVGTFDGLNRYDPAVPSFTTYRRTAGNPEGLAVDFVLPIMEDAAGRIWFGTFGGGISILQRDGGGREHFTHFRSPTGRHAPLCGNNIRSLLQDRAGIVWIGTGEGLTRYDPSTGTSTCLYGAHSRSHRLLWADALLETRGGRLIAGATELGMLSIEASRTAPGGFSAVPFALQDAIDGRRSSEIRAMVEDGNGSIWAATEAGLVRVDTATRASRRYLHNPADTASLSSDMIWSLLVDGSDPHMLWVGTAHGLNRLDVRTGRSRRYLEQRGFPNANVYGILSDGEGRLWLSTNHGLTCFDDRLPEGRKFRNYDVTDGLQGNEFNRHSYRMLRSGEMLFGGTRGATRFDPLRVRGDPRPPRVALTAFTLLGRPVLFDRDVADVETIELGPEDRVFAFEYVALDYANPTAVRYATRLEGLDRGWVDAGDRRFAGYTHLDPGEYIFRVTAVSRDGMRNEKGASVRIIVTPPFWKTWWFRLGGFAALAGGLLFVYRRRVQGLRREQLRQREFSLRLMESQEAERKRIAGELHDGLGQDLLVVRNRALVALKDPQAAPPLRNHLDEITAVATQALESVRGISHGLHPYQLEHLGLSKAVAALGASLSGQGGIRCTVEVDAADDLIPRDRVIHLYRIVQEAVNNVLKHSGATEVRIALRRSGDGLTLVIRDDGKGMHGESEGGPGPAEGFGIAGMRERVAILGGTLTVESRPGGGTTLTVTVPNAGGAV
jgi:signal transduction histidine kinase/ligand-binding sensor domain-containing protein